MKIQNRMPMKKCVHENPPGVTANLLGPLVVNVRSGRGRQLVLASSEHAVRHPVVG